MVTVPTLWIENFDDQQFYQYQQNEQLPILYIV